MKKIDLSRFPEILREIDVICRVHLYPLLGFVGNCPGCGVKLRDKPLASLMNGSGASCRSCRWHGVAREGTVLQNSKLSASQALLLFAFVVSNANPDTVSRLLGISRKTYNEWELRLRPLLIIDEQTPTAKADESLRVDACSDLAGRASALDEAPPA